MKCLLNEFGIVMPNRYHNDVAAQKVSTGMFSYCPKERWKKEVRDFVPEKSKNVKKKKAKRAKRALGANINSL